MPHRWTVGSLTVRTPRIACFATQGSGSGDEERIRSLLEPLSPTLLPFERTQKMRSALSILRFLVRERPDLVVMEGTGIAGGLALLASRVCCGVPYIVSSGDAVAPFIASQYRVLWPGAWVYERSLSAYSAGFIGWSPYLAGRALTLGAPRAMTAEGWAEPRRVAGGDVRATIRRRFGIPEDALVFGIVGSLAWNARRGYCYGAELVRAAARVQRNDLRVLVVGDGTGRSRLEQMAGDQLGVQVLIPGRVPRDEVLDVLAAIDIGSLPQSLDGVGSFRYTTKISEYLAARVPVVTGRIPLSYDLDEGWLWRLPGEAPWEESYVAALASLMETVTPREAAARSAAIPEESMLFSRARQSRRVCDFVREAIPEDALLA